MKSPAASTMCGRISRREASTWCLCGSEAGTRLKIFEAMGMAKAVVSTSIGAEGLPVSDGTDIMLADDPGTFADAVVRLIRDAESRRFIEQAARRLVVERYDWSAVAQDFEDALRGLSRFPDEVAGTT